MRGATASRHCKMLGTEFQSTLLMRGATCACSLRSLAVQNFNPRSSCEERLGFLQASGKSAHISIHAPHARSDVRRLARRSDHRQISIHAPHARSDDYRRSYFVAMLIFQSTLLMRGATRHCSRRPSRGRYFNPRSSCEERHGCMVAKVARWISIHAPHARSD